MSAAPDDRLTLAHARLLIEAGTLVFPCKPFDKTPATPHGFKDASIEPSVITGWFDNTKGFNLAVACGPQPSGIHLGAIDVDPKNGGDKTWTALTDTYGVPMAPRHSTPSGGFHLFFNSDLIPTGPNTFGPGIDTRGAGGYVVVPPSRLTNVDGELITYRTTAKLALATNAPPPPPPWIIDLLTRPDPVAESVARHPSQPADDSLYDLIRKDWAWEDELANDGWIEHSRSGGDIRLVRPGKNPRDGHSATLHASGAFVVFTTERPFGGKATNGAGGATFSPAEYVLAYRFGGDRSAMARAYRTGATPRVRAAPGGDWAGDGQVPPAVVTTVPTLNLADEFWSARPILAHIRQAAWSAACSPDALLIHALTRTATYLHPCFKLPGVEQGLIGKQQTLDFLGCVVAETSGGKTLAAGVGELLVPQPPLPSDGTDPMIDFEQKIGSGEGIAEFFLVPELKEDEDGKRKPTGRRIVGKQALFMSVDEGTGFTQQAGRKGTTIIATLASAWSGESLGQLNANAETRRLVQGGRVRICAVINMQTSNGYKLYTDELESVGFTGRLLFASAHDPGAPAEAPPWPGPLQWPIWPGAAIGNRFFTYAPDIAGEIRSTRHAILTGALSIEKRQSQYLLLRCKVAALLAMWEDRLNVTVEDWELATTIVATSASMLSHLDEIRSDQVFVTAVTTASFRKDVEVAADSAHVRRLRAQWRVRVLDRLRLGPLPWKGLKDITQAGDHRSILKDEVQAMCDEGLIEQDGTAYRLA